MIQSFDTSFLLHAQRLAARGLGRTWPNPAVGCVLVKNGVVIAVARTADGGRPHAETQALELAGAAARGATAYVSLEPCAHHGQTPPCAEALINAGIARVVYMCEDPDPRVAGKGAAMLRAAGIEVVNLNGDSRPTLYRGFFRRVTHGLPEVSLKIAISLDNQIADPTGNRRWITAPLARAHGHLLRANHDAVLTGIGTVLADDPLYTVRLPGVSHERFVRVVADRGLRLPSESQLVRTAEIQPLWVITTALAVEQHASHATELRERGVVVHVVDGDTLAPRRMLEILGSQGITRVLVEAGAALTTSFLEAKLVDTLHWYRAPLLLGNAGQEALAGLDSALSHAAHAQLVEHRRIGEDTYEKYALESCLPA